MDSNTSFETEIGHGYFEYTLELAKSELSRYRSLIAMFRSQHRQGCKDFKDFQQLERYFTYLIGFITKDDDLPILFPSE